jgi:hypothetical protein
MTVLHRPLVDPATRSKTPSIEEPVAPDHSHDLRPAALAAAVAVGGLTWLVLLRMVAWLI